MQRDYYDIYMDIHVYVWATKYNMEVTVMNKYVSLDKRSKKAQREYHAITQSKDAFGETLIP